MKVLPPGGDGGEEEPVGGLAGVGGAKALAVGMALSFLRGGHLVIGSTSIQRGVVITNSFIITSKVIILVQCSVLTHQCLLVLLPSAEREAPPAAAGHPEGGRGNLCLERRVIIVSSHSLISLSGWIDIFRDRHC